MTTAINTKQKMKKTAMRGTEPLDRFNGIFSATRSMNTIEANINVNATPILSPDSAGRMNVKIMRHVIKAIENTNNVP